MIGLISSALFLSELFNLNLCDVVTRFLDMPIVNIGNGKNV